MKLAGEGSSPTEGIRPLAGAHWWCMRRPCESCPFSENPGRVVLRDGRMEEIQEGLLRGGHFICHGSVNYDQRNKLTEKICMGSVEWQAKRGIVADFVQVMLRIEQAKCGRETGSV